MNDFEHRNFLYEIPYRTLVRKGYDNLITAGRSASGEGYAWDIVRVIPPAILTGQAAGCAAAQALSDGVGIDGIDVLNSKIPWRGKMSCCILSIPGSPKRASQK